MTKLLQDVIERVRQWPEDRQNEAAAMLLELETQRETRASLTSDQIREVERVRQKVIEGTAEYATDEQIEAFWKSCGL